jgi:hypothetical protein
MTQSFRTQFFVITAAIACAFLTIGASVAPAIQTATQPGIGVVA